jgi:hypothetical protein
MYRCFFVDDSISSILARSDGKSRRDFILARLKELGDNLATLKGTWEFYNFLGDAPKGKLFELIDLLKQ